MSRPLARPCPGRRSRRGAALLMVIFLVALIGILLTVAGRVWRTERQREKEAELIAVGNEIARAIARYQAASPQATREYPERLNELLVDRRQPVLVRHLRRLYRDPMTGKVDWGLVKDASGRITGVYSVATGEPLKQSGFSGSRQRFNNARKYSDWTFIAEVSNAPAGVMPGAVDPGMMPQTRPATGAQISPQAIPAQTAPQ
jgi:type II secretory pathway pseudopilin PulG